MFSSYNPLIFMKIAPPVCQTLIKRSEIPMQVKSKKLVFILSRDYQMKIENWIFVTS